MLETVILTRGQVWLSPEIREKVGLDLEEDQVSFAVSLDEASQVLEKTESFEPVARCA
ncbi:MAG TPA: hypothetical protein PKJ41_05630 [Bryobacteraceae bacterium]|nr:hypothetical protein [Bryobacteraceae bacterium]HPT28992.1 hypothetical protein [Bryobacteraceae bacterium]